LAGGKCCLSKEVGASADQFAPQIPTGDAAAQCVPSAGHNVELGRLMGRRVNCIVENMHTNIVPPLQGNHVGNVLWVVGQVRVHQDHKVTA
jgi:hypothetical protein